ncbi:LysR family transcriptional regulator [Pseudonocardia cypriaca]|uniref:LysR family transcriptional regulator n=1 Tax=Pseudonocardia cypriaca TaxID=882449 RepID=A0A543GDD7_9PSEU|nr:LysR family transcriptional regulator [Pseudonocardia cypriaca]TQM44083.1 LysR family transcriptional regulator [Pseudonocardia cypriaca]
MESRPLRYFVAVAEELNFTRAAERLGISAPPLSRAISKLEAELGVALFERSTHNVALTPPGAVLLQEARIALDALQAAGRRARRAAGPEPKLVLALKADAGASLLDDILARYSTDPAARPVAVHLCEWGEQPQLLRQGEVDVALVHEPFDHTGLDAETVATEPRIAAIPAGHPLAERDQLRVADLGIPTGELRRYLDPAAARRRPTGLAQLLTLVELGELIQLLPESVTARYPRPGVAYRSVVDAPAAVLAIAWPQQSRSQATAALVRAATALRTGA